MGGIGEITPSPESIVGWLLEHQDQVVDLEPPTNVLEEFSEADRHSASYWQSCSTQGQHWVRLEIQPDVLIQSLNMVLDPADSTYMPSMIVLSAGDNLTTLKEIRTVNVFNNDTNVSLLSSLKEYHKYIEIVIKQCRNGGIDSKIHGLVVTGRKLMA